MLDVVVHLHDTPSMKTLSMKNVRVAAVLITLLAPITCVTRLAGQTAPEIKLAVTGDVTTPLTLSASDLAAMPREHVEMKLEDGTKAAYDGVALQAILAKAGVATGHIRGKMLSGYVLAEAKDGYEVVFSIGELGADFGNTRVIVADTQDGKPLVGNKGPLRVVVPSDKEEARSVRMLENLEVVQLRK